MRTMARGQFSDNIYNIAFCNEEISLYDRTMQT